ncbi:polycystic kidney disease 2-like 2 protein [Strigops habroptila]|uniref:polycystic kidney disease 2-like 2 protein n=1 Tax=Strigops habroptila TaxID=2489341 RepID=UPI0011CF0EFC|nr:polycystic kidney disease 2-like 2 protein [Strigops habroptila]
MEPTAAAQLPVVDHRVTGRGAPKPRETSTSEQELKDMLRELVIYVIFLIDLCILAFGMVSIDMYHLNTVMSHLFMEPTEGEDGFGSIRTKADFWKFVEGPLLDGLYWDKWYNNTTLTLQNYSHIYYENLLLGVAQVRQVKVRNNTCSIYPYFHSFLDDCYSEYHYQAEDRSDDALRNESEWKYTPATSLSPWYLGTMGLYGSGGYLFTLPKSKQESMEKLASLKQNNWLTRGTRVVFIDFSTYNANLNLFCIVKLVVEFPATGGAFTSIHIYSVKLLRYITRYDYFLASCEIIFCLFIITFIIQEAIKIVKLKREYFRSGWSWLDLMLLMVSILAITFNIYSTVEVSLLMEELLSDANVYPDFYFLTFWQVLYNNMIAVNIFFAWIKVWVLKYVRFNKTMEQLSSTLSRCAKDIIGFAIMFFIVFFAYAQFGYLVFGSQVEEFSTFQKCIFTQFRIVLGDFDFEHTEAANRILGPIYFITFVFFVFFVLLNMFLAIINDTYSEVKADYEVMPSHKLPIRDLFRHSCDTVLTKLKMKKPEEDTQPAAEKSESKELPATRKKHVPKKEKSPSKVSELQTMKEKHQMMYLSAQNMASGPAQGYVTAADFQQLLSYTAELGKELNNTNARLRRIIRNMQHQKDAAGKPAR